MNSVLDNANNIIAHFSGLDMVVCENWWESNSERTLEWAKTNEFGQEVIADFANGRINEKQFGADLVRFMMLVDYPEFAKEQDDFSDLQKMVYGQWLIANWDHILRFAELWEPLADLLVEWGGEEIPNVSDVELGKLAIEVIWQIQEFQYELKMELQKQAN